MSNETSQENAQKRVNAFFKSTFVSFFTKENGPKIRHKAVLAVALVAASTMTIQLGKMAKEMEKQAPAKTMTAVYMVDAAGKKTMVQNFMMTEGSKICARVAPKTDDAASPESCITVKSLQPVSPKPSL